MAWQNFPLATEAGSFTVEFDATPSSATANAVAGLSNGPASAFTDLACIVRFNPDGGIDARNAGTYQSATPIPYTAGTTYHFSMAVDIPSHTYSAYVTAPTSAQQVIGTGLAFRTEQETVAQLDSWALEDSSAPETVCNFTLETQTSTSGGSTGATSTGGTGSGFSGGTTGGSGGPPYWGDGGPIVAVTDDGGWTILPGGPGTPGGYGLAIYVDSVNGVDQYDAGWVATYPLQNIDYGGIFYNRLAGLNAAQISAGVEVLLKPGSVWTAVGGIKLAVGGTAQYPILFTGERWPDAGTSPRPQIVNGFALNAVSHIAIEGLQIGPTAGSNEGVDITGGTDYLVEDCLITNFPSLVQASSSSTAQPVTNLRVRRNYLFGCQGVKVGAVDFSNTVGALIEDNFFDYNGSDGNYTSATLEQTSANGFGHDLYLSDNGPSVELLDFTVQHNVFTRTQQSIKGPYGGLVDDNLIYDYWLGTNGGYVGPDGVAFTNNVLVNGGGFTVSTDNGFSWNTDPTLETVFCNNLEYNENPVDGGEYGFQSAAGVPGSAAGSPDVGANVVYVDNVIDGFQRAIGLGDPAPFGYEFTNNLFQATSFLEFLTSWPIAGCPFNASGLVVYSPLSGGTSANGNGFGLELKGQNGRSDSYFDYADVGGFIEDAGGSFSASYPSQPIPFVDPSRNITSYLVDAGLASGSPTLLDYLTLVRTQAQTPHTWSPALSATAINAYLRAGHTVDGGSAFAYSNSCP